MWESAVARCCKLNRRCRTTSTKTTRATRGSLAAKRRQKGLLVSAAVVIAVPPRDTEAKSSHTSQNPDFAAIFGIIKPGVPVLNGSNCANEHFSGTFWQPDIANQVRLVLHTGAYWLMLRLRDAIPMPQPPARAQFATLPTRLIKIGARIAETASRVRIAFAAAHPEAALFASLARSLYPAGP